MGSFVWGLGCGDDTVRAAQSRLEGPDRVDFGLGIVGQTAWQNVSLKNLGQGTSQIFEVKVPPPFVLGKAPETVGPGQTSILELGYTPREEGAMDQGTLELSEREGLGLSIELIGSTGYPELSLTEAEIDFGVVDEGQTAFRTVELQNLGSGPLVLQDLVWSSASMDLVPLTRSRPRIEGQSAFSLEFSYAPVDIGSDEGTMTVVSNDRVQSRLDIAVRGQANLRPIVQLGGCRADDAGPDGCGAAAVSNLIGGIDEVILLEATATDPEGQALSFRWTVRDRPEGSYAAVLFGRETEPEASVLLDRSGRYRIEVVAFDERGLASEPAIVEVRPPDVRVSLRWNLPTDVDLHLVKPRGQVGDYGNGVAGRSRGTDCSPFNRSPAWGLPGSDDDPRLEQDAVTTRGPESVRIDGLESGRYEVYAHYCDSRNVRSVTDARLEVSLRGDLVATLGPQALTPGDLWKAAELVWNPDQETVTVFPLEGEIRNDPGLCRID